MVLLIRSAVRPALVVAISFLMSLGCTDPASDEEVVVFAAASLTDAFEEIAAELERAEDVTVRFNFGASSDLARSIADGGPAEVFAAADEVSMQAVVQDGLAEGERIFATNRMAIAVADGNPLGVADLNDLADLSVAVCAPEVPCGHYAREVLERADVALRPRSFEADVKAVLTRVAMGEVDAGIVYVSDVMASPDVSSVPIPEEANIVAGYPIALIGDAPSDEARAFRDLLLSATGSRILDRHGFGPP